MKVLFLLAEGFEETEFIAPWDLLIRAGADVKTASINNNKTVAGAHNMNIIADFLLPDVLDTDIDMLVLPGGSAGVANLKANETVLDFIKKTYNRNSFIAAICAAPSILGFLGLLDGKKATAFPSFANQLNNAVLSDEKVVRDGKIITAKAVGASLEFGFELINALYGSECLKTIKESTYY